MDSLVSTRPMEQLSVDLIGPLPSTARRHKHLLVIIDKFTKYVELFPLRPATSPAIVEKMVDVFSRHGFPESISSDNGRVFISKICKGVLQRMRIKDRHTVPSRPSGQLVERHNAADKQCIMAYFTSHRDWDKCNPEIAFAMRTSQSGMTG